MDTAPDIARIRQATPAELAQIVAAGLPGPGWTYVQALREEASTFHNTDTSTAREIAERAMELAELLDDPLAFGWALRTMAEALLCSGQVRESEEYYERAAEAWRGAGADGWLGQLLVGHILVNSLLGYHDKIASMASEARAFLTEAEDQVYLAKLAISLGSSHHHRDLYGPALEEYDNALRILQQSDERSELIISIEINRAVSLTNLNRDQEGLTLYRKLEEVTGDMGLELLQAQTRMNAAHIHAQRAEFDEAHRILAKATTYFRHTQHPSFLATCLFNRAEVYHQLNLHSNAMELAEESVRLFAAEEMTHHEAIALSQSALTLIALGQLEEALPKIDRAESLFLQDKNNARAAQMRLISGEALFLQDRLEEAHEHYESAWATFHELDLQRWEAAACVLGAKVFSARCDATETNMPGTLSEDGEQLIGQLKKNLIRLPQAVYPLQRYRVLEALGELLQRSVPSQKSGATNSVDSVFREALSCLEDVRVRVPTEDSKISFLQDKTHLYDRLLSLELKREMPDPDVIFEWMERARAQSLWDRLRSPRSYLDTDSDESASEFRETRRHLSWLHARLSQMELGTAEERNQTSALRAQIVEAEAQWSRMLREQSESSGVGVVSDAGRAMRLKPVQESLPDGWGWISYHLGSNFSLAMIATRTGARWISLQNDLSARVTSLCDRLDFQWTAAALSSVQHLGASRSSARKTQTQGTTSVPAAGSVQGVAPGPAGPHRMLQATTDRILAELYTLLWEPLQDHGITQDLNWIVSPHGPIHRVPLHALRGPNGYLVEHLDIALSPSARVWRELSNSAREKASQAPAGTARKTTSWVAGVPSSQLPAVEIEVNRVGRHLNRTDVVKDLHPTRESFVSEAPKADLIHLAAHGSLRKDNPAFSYIELADGPFFVHDLASVQLRPSTVVLTACSSARGAAPAGDEWIGLARGFLQAGANTVVASLWPIQDQPTLELMDLFYARLKDQTSVPIAMGDAMRKLIRTRPHPWHWASFAVLGGVPATQTRS